MMPATVTLMPTASKLSPGDKLRRSAKCLPTRAASLRFTKSWYEPEMTLMLGLYCLRVCGGTPRKVMTSSEAPQLFTAIWMGMTWRTPSMRWMVGR